MSIRWPSTEARWTIPKGWLPTSDCPTRFSPCWWFAGAWTGFHIGAGSIWITAQADAFTDWINETPAGPYAHRRYAVLRIDPDSDQVLATIPIEPVKPALAAFGLGSFWILGVDNTLLRVDPKSNRVEDYLPRKENPYHVKKVWPTGQKRLKRSPLLDDLPDDVEWIDHLGPIPVAALVRVTDTYPPMLSSPSFDAYPREALESFREDALSAPEYHLQGQRVRVEFLTPPVLQGLLRNPANLAVAKGFTRYTPGEDFLGWRRLGEGIDATVVLQAVPRAMNKRPRKIGPKKFFEPPVRFMKLRRDGIEVSPLDPQRVCAQFKLISQDTSEEWRGSVSGCYASYAYAPEVFEPGGDVELQVFLGPPVRSGFMGTLTAEPETLGIPAETLDRIWSDFQPYFEAKRVKK